MGVQDARGGSTAYRQPCWESQRRAFHLVRANGTVLAEVEYRGDLIMWVHAKGVRSATGATLMNEDEFFTGIELSSAKSSGMP